MHQVNITLGTAGHIDHGKTALVKCLTGCETDRLKEEKERGMSIDLGFAPCKIADMQVGIVDVPGHENFIKTMVAGASGMDAVILVVAADDGVMPQTREHLEILTLLGIQHGIVALTKIDRVPNDDRQKVIADVAYFLQNTFLANAPILPLSNITGEGFDKFLESLWDLVKSIKPKRTDGVFRMPLERAFTVQGYGTVVAGIPVSGSARVGDEVVLLPDNLAGRIRRIEVYGDNSDAVVAGQCAALNVGHWDHREIRRGDTLTLPGYFEPKEWFVCKIRLLNRDKLTLKSGAEVKFHTGTTDVAAMFYPLKGNYIEGGFEGLIQVRTKNPVVAAPGDYFILRTPSPVRTIGGGRIVEPVDRRYKASHPNVFEDLQERANAVFDECAFVEYCIRRTESLSADEQAISIRTKIPRNRLKIILNDLQQQNKIFPVIPGVFIHCDTASTINKSILDLIAGHHQESPESPGLSLEQLRQSLSIDRQIIDHLVADLKTHARLVENNQRLALPEHRSTFADEDAKLLAAIEALFSDKYFQPPGLDDIAQHTSIPADKLAKILKILKDHGRLIEVEKGIFFHADAIVRAREILTDHFSKEPRLESVQFKYLLDTTRKFALPMLDYMDKIGATRRVGNTRFPKK